MRITSSCGTYKRLVPAVIAAISIFVWFVWPTHRLKSLAAKNVVTFISQTEMCSDDH